MSYLTVLTPDEIKWHLVGTAQWWRNALTVSFPTAIPSDYLSTANFTPVNAMQMQATLAALASYSDVCKLKVTNVGNNANGDIRVFNNVDVVTAATFYPGPNIGGDILINGSDPDYASPVRGNWAYLTILHEVGHALGLSHPGAYNGGYPTYFGSAEFQQDSLQYTVMSYFEASNTGADHEIGGVVRYADTLLLYDILAIQSIYGQNLSVRTGGSTYGFHSTSGIAAYDFTKNLDPIICIWDAGGTDTLDFSGFTAATRMDLRPGSFSDTPEMTKNVSIAYGTIIENAVGGSGNDVITGNSANNTIWGGAGHDWIGGGFGNDVLYGQLGNDTLYGSVGADTMYGGSGNDTYYVDDPNDAVRETSSTDGKDTLRVVSLPNTMMSYTLPANVEDLIIEGQFIARGFGNELNNTMSGNGAPNSLRGFAGDDTIYGSLGDTLYGGLGNDVYIVDLDFPLVVENANEGIDTVLSASTFTLPKNVERLALTSNFADFQRGTGNSLDNTILGNGARDDIYGLDGNDFLGGRGNDDRIWAGNGDDTVYGDGGSDWLYGGAGADKLIGGAGNDYIVGNADSDTLIGGYGSDWLEGDLGADTFVFDSPLSGSGFGPNLDTIIDFNTAEDFILLSRTYFSTLSVPGTLWASEFHIGSAAEATTDRIIYDPTTGVLSYDWDGSDTAGSAIAFAKLSTGLALTAADFIVV